MRPPAVTDLVLRAQQGDRAAFEQLYRQEVGRVYALCLRLAGDSVLAEEYVQDTFIRMWERLPSFRGESAFSSWLYRLTVNVVLQEHRTRRRREQRVQPGPVPREPAVVPDGTAERMDLEWAVARLPDGARQVFVLHDVEGYRHAEIAALLGIAVGTSKSHLHRARRVLRAALQC